MQDARMIKTPEEMILMRHAGEVTALALEEFQQAIKAGVSEEDLLQSFGVGF